MNKWLLMLALAAYVILTVILYRGLIPFLLSQASTASNIIAVVIAIVWFILSFWAVDHYRNSQKKDSK